MDMPTDLDLHWLQRVQGVSFKERVNELVELSNHAVISPHNNETSILLAFYLYIDCQNVYTQMWQIKKE